MKILRNIHSKIWTCVSVALLSYLVATLSTSWVNIKTRDSINHIQKIDLPANSKGILVHSLFNSQGEEYENGLLTGEEGDIIQANTRHEQITLLLDELAQLTTDAHLDIHSHVLALRDDYSEYFSLASNHYMESLQGEDIFASRKVIHQLGRLRAALDQHFLQVTDMLQQMIENDLIENKRRLEHYTRLLHILFVLFMLLTMLVIKWLANKEIIAPLKKIQKMISDFSRGRNIDRPKGGNGEDEIHALATSFWQMTRELNHLTATSDYVNNIINNMSDSLVILNPDFSIQTVNRATVDLLLASEEELTGCSFRDFFVFNKEDKSATNVLFQELFEGKPINNIEAQYVTSEEQPVAILFSASPLYLPDGTLQGISCLAREISELKEQREQLQFLANFDKLTGLANRDLFHDRLAWTVKDAKRHDYLFAVLFLDLDRFKSINDNHGHAAGDLVLQEVASRLLATVRDTDTVCRLGGDEFTILLSRIHEADEATRVADKVLHAFDEPFLILGNHCSLGVSVGICLSSPDLSSAESIVKNADTAMYAAKAQGRGCYMVSSAEQVE